MGATVGHMGSHKVRIRTLLNVHEHGDIFGGADGPRVARAFVVRMATNCTTRLYDASCVGARSSLIASGHTILNTELTHQPHGKCAPPAAIEEVGPVRGGVSG